MELSQVETEGLFIVGAAFLERFARFVVSPTLEVARKRKRRRQGYREVFRCKDGDSVVFKRRPEELIADGVGEFLDGRLNRINAPDKEPAKTRSKKALEKKIGDEARVVVLGPCKYGGRFVVEVFKGRTNISDWMVKKGYARAYDGGKRDPNY